MIHSIPTYLKGQATGVDGKILAEIQSNYGEYSTAFKFNKKFKCLVRTWMTKYDEFGSTIWGINVDDERIAIFNPMENGYNGMFNNNGNEDYNSTKTINFENEVDLIAMFQYGGDEAEYAEEGKSKFAEDYFDWVAIYKYDNNGLEEIVSIECA
jgi:hypothetical protein